MAQSHLTVPLDRPIGIHLTGPWSLQVRKRIRGHSAQARDLKRTVAIDTNWDFAHHDPGPEDFKDVEDLIEHLCSTLPPHLQQVLRMQLEDCSVREMATQLDRSTKMVRLYIKKLREHLLLNLPEELQDPARKMIEAQKTEAESEEAAE